MKKLMFVATAVLMGGVCSAAIESENVVGYTGNTTGESCNFVTIPFNTVGNNTADIQSIKLSDGGAGSIGWGTETFAVWEGAPTIVDGSSFVYCDASLDPAGEATGYYWGDGQGNKATYAITANQGVVVECAAGLTMTIAVPYSL